MSFYIGILSGTSVDSIDVTLVDIDGEKIKLCNHLSHPFSDALRQSIQSLIEQQSCHFNHLCNTDYQIAHEFAVACTRLLEKSQVEAKQICAIGSHGQTIYHQPEGEYKSTLQIGSPHVLAAKTGIPVVANFRNMDMALDGQGAPLAPLLHQKLFAATEKNICVLNLGGIANITFLGPDFDTVIGYDTGPANCLMDSWIKIHKRQSFDSEGLWAKSGSLNKILLDQMLGESFFKKTYPKSTGRELFNLKWFDNFEDQFKLTSAIDIQTTLAHLTAKSVAIEINKQADKIDQIVVMGGGAKNTFLLELINKYTSISIIKSDDFGYPSEWIEAILFAYLAHKRVQNQPLDLSKITGSYQKFLVGDIIQLSK